MVNFSNILFAVGVCFLGSLIAGRLSAMLRVPKVTGYLVVGLVAGPSLAHIFGYPVLITTELLKLVKVISDVALAFIMLTIGSQFKLQSLRRWGVRLIKLSITEMFVTFVFVFTTLFLLVYLIKIPIDGHYSYLVSVFYFSLLLAIISMTTSPAASLMVIREFESEGSLTDIIISLIGLNNLVSILLFNIALHFMFNGNDPLGMFLFKLFGPIAIGFIAGMIISIWAESLNSPTEFLLLLIGGTVAAIGLVWKLHLDVYLSCFIMGMFIINSSPKAVKLFDALRTVDYPLYVFFFVIAGASLHLEALANIGIIGIVYILIRTAGKIIGSRLGAQFGEFGYVVKKWLGIAMIAKAGIAIGLAQSVARVWPGGGDMVETIVLGSFVVFEVVGPITVRHSLVHAGEVPILSLLVNRTRNGTFEGFHHVFDHFRSSLGVPVGHQFNSAADIMVKHVMRKNVETIGEETPFNEILRLLAHSKYDRFPVVNKQNKFVGVINYSEIRDILFDQELSSLVLARDLMTPEPLALNPEQTLGEVLEIFRQNSNVTYLPIVDINNTSELLGITSQNDVLAAFRKVKKQNV